MVRSIVSPLVHAALLLAAFSLPLLGQSGNGQPDEPEFKGRILPGTVEPKPFALEGKHTFTVDFRDAGQMSEKDRLLVADAESSIAEHAAIAGFDFDKASFTYQQLVCPALPNHLFLQFMRDNGTGDVTVFSASIPRNGAGRVRIIPILRRGYSLFSPAPINAITIAAFNHIRAEEQAEHDADWMGNGLCYAALAGAHPQIPSHDAVPEPHKPVPAIIATMHVQLNRKNQEILRFADAAAMPRPMEWTMVFSRNGKLLKATHVPAPMATAHKVAEKPAVTRTWNVPQN